jgi:protein-tyrosine-phosphatase
MAEHLCRHKLSLLGLGDDFQVLSRSLSTNYEPEGSPASDQGIQVMQDDYGINMTSHSSKLLSVEDVSRAEFIIPVKRDLGEHIATTFLDARKKIRYLERDIPDPWHQPAVIFRSCAANISSLLDKLLPSFKDSSSSHK